MNRYFGVDNSATPWLGGKFSMCNHLRFALVMAITGNIAANDQSKKLVGWMIETMVIDPFDSNHLLLVGRVSTFLPPLTPLLS